MPGDKPDGDLSPARDKTVPVRNPTPERNGPAIQHTCYLTVELLQKLARGKSLDDLKVLKVVLPGRGEKLRCIENLDKVPFLENLNVSHHNIAKIEKLEKLKQLKELNLSFNLIAKIENLSHLFRLEVLDLSHNKIKGIPSCVGDLKRLRSLLLNDNDIERLIDVKHIRGCGNLTSVTLSGNPVAELEAYSSYVTYNLSQLQYLDTNAISEETREMASTRWNREGVQEVEALLTDSQADVATLQTTLKAVESNLHLLEGKYAALKVVSEVDKAAVSELQPRLEETLDHLAVTERELSEKHDDLYLLKAQFEMLKSELEWLLCPEENATLFQAFGQVPQPPAARPRRRFHDSQLEALVSHTVGHFDLAKQVIALANSNLADVTGSRLSPTTSRLSAKTMTSPESESKVAATTQTPGTSGRMSLPTPSRKEDEDDTFSRYSALFETSAIEADQAKELSEEVGRLEARRLELQATLKTLETQNEVMGLAIIRKEEAGHDEALAKAVEVLRAQEATLKESVHGLQSQEDRFKDSIHGLQSQEGDLQSSISNLKQQEQELRNAIRELQEQLHALQLNLAGSRDTESEVAEKIRVLEELCNQRSKEAEALQLEVDRLNETFLDREGLYQGLGDVKAQAFAAQQQLQSAQVELAECQAQKEHVKATEENLAKQIEGMEIVLARMRADEEALKREMERLQSVQRGHEVQAQHSEQGSGVHHQHASSEQVNYVSQLVFETTTLQQRQQAVARELVWLNEQVTLAKVHLQNIKMEEEVCTSSIAKLKENKEQLLSQVKELMVEVDRAQIARRLESKNTLEGETNRDDGLDTLRLEHEHLREYHGSLRKQCDSLEVELARQREMSVQQQREEQLSYEVAQKRRTELKEEEDHLQRRCITLLSQSRALSQEVQQLEIQRINLKETAIGADPHQKRMETHDLRQIAQALMVQEQETRLCLRLLRAERDSMDRDVQQLFSQLKALKKTLEEGNSSSSNKDPAQIDRVVVNQLNQEKDVLYKDVEGLRQEQASVRNEVARLVDEVKGVCDKLHKKQQELAVVSGRVNSLRAEESASRQRYQQALGQEGDLRSPSDNLPPHVEARFQELSKVHAALEAKVSHLKIDQTELENEVDLLQAQKQELMLANIQYNNKLMSQKLPDIRLTAPDNLSSHPTYTPDGKPTTRRVKSSPDPSGHEGSPQGSEPFADHDTAQSMDVSGASVGKLRREEFQLRQRVAELQREEVNLRTLHAQWQDDISQASQVAKAIQAEVQQAQQALVHLRQNPQTLSGSQPNGAVSHQPTPVPSELEGIRARMQQKQRKVSDPGSQMPELPRQGPAPAESAHPEKALTPLRPRDQGIGMPSPSSEMTERLHLVRAQVQAAEQQHHRLEREVALAEQKLLESNGRIERQMHEERVLQGSCERLQQDILARQEAIEALNFREQHAKHGLLEQQQQVQAYEREIGILSLRLKALEEDCGDRQKMIVSSENQLQAVIQNLKHSQRELEHKDKARIQLVQELEAMQMQKEEGFVAMAQIEAAERGQQHLDEQTSALRAQLVHLQAEFEKRQLQGSNGYQVWKAELGDVQETLKHLKNEETVLKADINALTTQRQKLEELIEALARELQDMRQKVWNAGKESDMEDQRQMAIARTLEHKQHWEQSQEHSKLVAMHEEREALGQEIRRADNQLKSLKAIGADIQHEVEGQKMTLEKHSERIEMLRKEEASLDASLQQLHQRGDDEAKRVQALQAQYHSVRKDVEALQCQKTQLDSSLYQPVARERVEVVSLEVSMLEAKIEAMTAEEESLRRRIETYKSVEMDMSQRVNHTGSPNPQKDQVSSVITTSVMGRMVPEKDVQGTTSPGPMSPTPHRSPPPRGVPSKISSPNKCVASIPRPQRAQHQPVKDDTSPVLDTPLVSNTSPVLDTPLVPNTSPVLDTPLVSPIQQPVVNIVGQSPGNTSLDSLASLASAAERRQGTPGSALTPERPTGHGWNTDPTPAAPHPITTNPDSRVISQPEPRASMSLSQHPVPSQGSTHAVTSNMPPVPVSSALAKPSSELLVNTRNPDSAGNRFEETAVGSLESVPAPLEPPRNTVTGTQEHTAPRDGHAGKELAQEQEYHAATQGQSEVQTEVPRKRQEGRDQFGSLPQTSRVERRPSSTPPPRDRTRHTMATNPFDPAYVHDAPSTSTLSPYPFSANHQPRPEIHDRSKTPRGPSKHPQSHTSPIPSAKHVPSHLSAPDSFHNTHANIAPQPNLTPGPPSQAVSRSQTPSLPPHGATKVFTSQPQPQPQYHSQPHSASPNIVQGQPSSSSTHPQPRDDPHHLANATYAPSTHHNPFASVPSTPPPYRQDHSLYEPMDGTPGFDPYAAMSPINYPPPDLSMDGTPGSDPYAAMSPMDYPLPHMDGSPGFDPYANMYPMGYPHRPISDSSQSEQPLATQAYGHPLDLEPSPSPSQSDTTMDPTYSHSTSHQSSRLTQDTDSHNLTRASSTSHTRSRTGKSDRRPRRASSDKSHGHGHDPKDCRSCAQRREKRKEKKAHTEAWRRTTDLPMAIAPVALASEPLPPPPSQSPPIARHLPTMTNKHSPDDTQDNLRSPDPRRSPASRSNSPAPTFDLPPQFHGNHSGTPRTGAGASGTGAEAYSGALVEIPISGATPKIIRSGMASSGVNTSLHVVDCATSPVIPHKKESILSMDGTWAMPCDGILPQSLQYASYMTTGGCALSGKHFHYVHVHHHINAGDVNEPCLPNPSTTSAMK